MLSTLQPSSIVCSAMLRIQMHLDCFVVLTLCFPLQTRWHQQNAKMQVSQVLDTRLKPCEIKEPSSGKVCKSYKELIGVRTKSVQEETDRMRKIQKDVKHMYQPAKEQMGLLADCQRLLQCKRHCLQMAQGQGGFDPDDARYGAENSVENHIVL